MVVAHMFVGVVTGVLVAVGSFIAGCSIWTAATLYMFAGSLGLLASAAMASGALMPLMNVAYTLRNGPLSRDGLNRKRLATIVSFKS